MRYWKKGIELHFQTEKWGNDLTCTEKGELGRYVPLSDEEHINGGYVEITRQEAEEMAEIAGIELR